MFFLLGKLTSFGRHSHSLLFLGRRRIHCILCMNHPCKRLCYQIFNRLRGKQRWSWKSDGVGELSKCLKMVFDSCPIEPGIHSLSFSRNSMEEPTPFPSHTWLWHSNQLRCRKNKAMTRHTCGNKGTLGHKVSQTLWPEVCIFLLQPCSDFNFWALKNDKLVLHWSA